MALHFSKEEFSKRKQDVLKSMKEQNLDALLMFRQESMYWLTGYDTFGYVFFQTLVLDQKGNVVLLTRAPDLRQAQNTSNIQDIRIWVDKDGINPTDDLKVILKELDLKNKNIGIEYEAYGMTGRNALRLNKSLENYCKVEDQSELITKLRVIKSNEELIYVKQAAELADRALDEAWKYTKAGVNEAKILAEMQRAVLEGGGDYPANEYIIGSVLLNIITLQCLELSLSEKLIPNILKCMKLVLMH
jgi:Xaa-Pro dipeptidase